MRIRISTYSHRSWGIALLEALASGIILAIMLTLTLKAYHSRLDRIGDMKIREYAGVVAERQMEILLASQQEPDDTGTYQEDNVDPDFIWKVDLERIVVDDDRTSEIEADYMNTLIKATITVKLNSQSDMGIDPVERIRYMSFLRGVDGNPVGVPLPKDDVNYNKNTQDKDEEPLEPEEKDPTGDLADLDKEIAATEQRIAELESLLNDINTLLSQSMNDDLKKIVQGMHTNTKIDLDAAMKKLASLKQQRQILLSQ
ncbi:MAG: hypothetical protein JEZ07_09250 [Phycisphaerae bacterium]|nr:hypothetical protein [Phycisphaerae bacterium]